ncbi:hypothetical protein HELRODRAFT_193281 [Helobdella robusta]|uniref:Exocyst complex component 2 n=1 Tax=Helobdella robusta TaxID=6412 RepID=T1FUT9_HELRO|nr:hypothetical protein HELRODRAFT_193281 [Helobdella robusta]ESN97150.1 hypothetical protein HELRODRAFT_193281 [Helobdella robusta]
MRLAPPQVTGISPKEGPPGTRVTIRGENLGVDAKDLIGLKICDVDCLLSAVWKSSKQIIARTGQAKVRGDIIVTTRSGGVGSSTVQFRGFKIQIGPLQDSAIWVDESQLYTTLAQRDRTAASINQQLGIGEDDDPLGICDESNDSAKKISEEELQELIPEGSGNTSLENFDPAWFLLENHQRTSFDDLKSGLAHLKHKMVQRDDGPFSFAKNNLTTFLNCFDTLTEMNKMMIEDEKTSKLSCTDKLEDIVKETKKTAEGIFEEVLGRKEKADATRNALAVLLRFKLLFYLPCTIDKNIAKGDYDLVVTDYTRTKSLIWLADIPVFKKIFDEIESRMKLFKEMLYDKLYTLPTTIEEQKKYIRYISHLESDNSAAWQCMVNQHKWIIQLMKKSNQDYVAKEAEEERKKSSAENASSSSAAASSSSHGDKFGNNNHRNAKPGARVTFIEALTKILCDNYPHLQRLGQSYFSGRLLKEVMIPDKVDSSKEKQFKAMLHEIIILYTNLIGCAFLPHTIAGQSDKREEFAGWPIALLENNYSLLSWLPVCVKNLRYSINHLQQSDLSAESMSLLLQSDWLLRISCVDSLLNKAIIDVKNLGERELWTVDNNDKHGSTTILPVLFEGVVMEAMFSLKDVVENKPNEKPLFGDEVTKQRIVELCSKLLQIFSTTLYKLATFKDDDVAASSTAAAATLAADPTKAENLSKKSNKSKKRENAIPVQFNGQSLSTVN